jgi:hypothetical protein
MWRVVARECVGMLILFAMPCTRFARAARFLTLAAGGVFLPASVHAQAQSSEQNTSEERASPALTRLSDEAREKAERMADRAIAWLRTKQDGASGGWSIPPQGKGPTFPAITGLVLTGMLMHDGISDADPTVSAGVLFLLNSQQSDGGIYVGMLPAYNTAISLTALSKVQQPASVADARQRAVEFLKSIQYGEGATVYDAMSETAQRVDPAHPFYGGFGYGNRGRPDLSNTSFALEALHAAGVDDNDPAIIRARTFLARCQMLAEVEGKPVNDMPYAAGSAQGGFIYATAINKDTVGQGQSFAGETAESLSGPPGSQVTFVLGKGSDGKPLALTKDIVEKRLRDAAGNQLDLRNAQVPFDLLVLLGPTGDGKTSGTFTVRSNAALGRLKSVVTSAFKDELASGETALTGKDVPAWQGVTRLRAYGSMTYAGLKSMIYAGLSRDDARVLAAKDWITRHYTLDENPGVGSDGQYYYYVMLSRALDAFGEPTLDVLPANADAASPAFRRVRWAEDLIAKLETLQEDDGSFRSVDDRWMEDNKVLITAYALVALQHARR